LHVCNSAAERSISLFPNIYFPTLGFTYVSHFCSVCGIVMGGEEAVPKKLFSCTRCRAMLTLLYINIVVSRDQYFVLWKPHMHCRLWDIDPPTLSRPYIFYVIKWRFLCESLVKLVFKTNLPSLSQKVVGQSAIRQNCKWIGLSSLR
jgi:hypothetical protein